MNNRVEKYIDIEEHGTSESGKTKIWLVKNTRAVETIGHIAWHGPFRKYCFYPVSNTLFDHDCLRLIGDHCEESTKEHYRNK